ncbi:integrase core domain-containing protein [Streptomyces sp. NPDC014744]|uniref:integrase core domain-containing protein n=1 Tax=Streptomyces sp. NPDC014744 TaxID=3364903 RepID=UPI0036FC7F47
MALWQRDREGRPHTPEQLIHHSDAGSQYTSFKLADHLDAEGIAASIGSVGDAYDNALMESTIGLYKTELLKPQRPWKSPSQVELATAEWVDWYNHRRLHGEIGHVPPSSMKPATTWNPRNPRSQPHLRSLPNPGRFTGNGGLTATGRQNHPTNRSGSDRPSTHELGSQDAHKAGSLRHDPTEK